MTLFSYEKRITSPFIFTCLMALLIMQTACSLPTGNPENGEKWFKKNNCFFCHGKNGKNGKAPTIAGLEMSFRSFRNKLRKPDSAIMPTFPENIVSDQDAADIYVWLKNNP